MVRANPSNEAKPSPLAVLKKFRVPIVVLLLWGGFITYQVQGAEDGPRCPGHWHSTIDLFLDEDRVFFTDTYSLERQTVPMSNHMHDGSEGVMHYEPTPSRCISTSEALEDFDVDISSSKIVLSGSHQEAGTYATNETHSITVYKRAFEGEWQKSSVGALNKQPRDGSSYAIFFGDLTEAEREWQLEIGTVAYPAHLAPIPPQFPVMPIIASSIFAILALVLWRKFATTTN